MVVQVPEMVMVPVPDAGDGCGKCACACGECCEGTSFCGGGREGGSVPIVMVSVLVMVKVLVSVIAMVGSEGGSASNTDGERASASQFWWVLDAS